jgi:hypothetical protein
LIPTLIKIDVEGAEMLVLEGAQQLIEKYHPALIVAIHPYWLPAHQSADQIFTFLSRHGYSCKESHIVWMDDVPVGDYLFCTRGDQGRYSSGEGICKSQTPSPPMEKQPLSSRQFVFAAPGSQLWCFLSRFH